MYDLSCRECSAEFRAIRPDKLYCSPRCVGRAGRRRRGEQTDITAAGRDCPRCGKHFGITPPSTNQRYCSVACAREATRELRRIWARRDPSRQRGYNAHRPYRDTKLNRMRRRYPDIPTACESCGEDRILEIAHKPEFARNGAWALVSNTLRHMFWVLCPTCHKLLDRGICNQVELGLS
jgi:hypothetical protein